ncbi:MAG: glycosyl hydrolase [bacterium]
MKLRSALFAFVSVCVLAAGCCVRVLGYPDDFEENFRMPSAEFGSAPFWSWNEALEPDELIRQIDEFADKGMGGFFMHSREGLITEYMGPEWMEAVRISVRRAKEKGLLAYMYDEDRWPSGFASGKVPRMNEDFRQKGLVVVESEEPLPEEKIAETGKLVKVFEAELKDDALVSFKDVSPAPAGGPGQGKVLLYFIVATAEPTEWFNGETYIDTMNPDAVDAFIEVTHEEYKKVIGDEFGKTVPAIFTDEPEYKAGRHFSYSTVPWTWKLPDVFKESRGYSIEEKLPLLFYSGEGAAAVADAVADAVRLDFWTTATEMFRDAFAKRIFDWGERNNVKLTGHYMLEDTLTSQVSRIGAAMPQYEYMQMPGMDHLGRNVDNLLTAKQVSSAAHQFSRPLILTETYGCSGWNLSFENMKWMSDWHYALGVNFMNQHLSWYSMRGARKRDYPASIQYQSPWWKYHNLIADYLRRATFVTASGKYVAETLVLHPITSAWAVFSPAGETRVLDLHNSFNKLIYALSGRQVDYDLGDEIIISRHGAVRGGKFVVKDMEYSVVVIPEEHVLRRTTVELLGDFIEQGGKVISIGGNEYLADARERAVLDGAVVAKDIEDAILKLIPSLNRHVEVSPASGALYLHQRDIGDSTFLFFANTDAENGVDVAARLPYAGRVREWNLFDGAAKDIQFEKDGGGIAVKLHFEPAGSALLSVTPGEGPQDIPPEELRLVREQPVPDEWAIADRAPNAVTVDQLRYEREGDANLSAEVPYYVAQESMVSKGTGFPFRVQYGFIIGMDPAGLKEAFVVMEQPEGKKIILNGKTVDYADAGWWIDRSFKKVEIGNSLRKGKNVLEVQGTFKRPKVPGTRKYVPGGTEIESVYIVGDFSVEEGRNGKFAVRPANDTFFYGDMVKKGYPFFAGSMTIEKKVDIDVQPGEKVFLELDGLEAITARVWVNGGDAGVIAFHPHRVDVTPFVKSGKNAIRIELTNSNRNLLGPHHAVEREPLSVGPGTFRGEILKRHYNFIPFGITKGVTLKFFE